MGHEFETRSSTILNTFKCVCYNANLYMQTSISRIANFYNHSGNNAFKTYEKLNCGV